MKKLFTLLLAVMFGIATFTQSSMVLAQTTPTTKHLKKDGTPDKRFKENKTPKAPLKKDGTPDMRYKANKDAAPKKSDGGHVGNGKKDGGSGVRGGKTKAGDKAGNGK